MWGGTVEKQERGLIWPIGTLPSLAQCQSMPSNALKKKSPPTRGPGLCGLLALPGVGLGLQEQAYVQRFRVELASRRASKDWTPGVVSDLLVTRHYFILSSLWLNTRASDLLKVNSASSHG